MCVWHLMKVNQCVMDRRKKLLNSCEDSTDISLRNAVEKHGARVFAKIRIADVLRIEGSGISDEEYKYALMGHFDFVIARDNRADFAVEFDGPTHETDATTIRRDRLKRSLCKKLGMPLLRIDEEHLRQVERQTIVGWLVHVWYMHEAWTKECPASSFEDFDYFGWFTIDPRAEQVVKELLEQGFTQIGNQVITKDDPSTLDAVRKLCRPKIDVEMNPFFSSHAYLQQSRDIDGFDYEIIRAVDDQDYCVCFTVVTVDENTVVIGNGRCQINPGWPVTGFDVAFELSMLNAADNLKSYKTGNYLGAPRAEADKINRLVQKYPMAY